MAKLKQDLKDAKKGSVSAYGDFTSKESKEKAIKKIQDLIDQEIEAKRTGKFAPKPLVEEGGFAYPEISSYATALVQRKAERETASTSKPTSGQVSSAEEVLEKVRRLSEKTGFKPTQIIDKISEQQTVASVDVASKPVIESALLNQPEKINLSTAPTLQEINNQIDNLETVKEVQGYLNEKQQKYQLLKGHSSSQTHKCNLGIQINTFKNT